MPELYVEPHILAGAGRPLAAQRSVLFHIPGALVPAFPVVAAAPPGPPPPPARLVSPTTPAALGPPSPGFAAALPGSRPAKAAGHTATPLPAAVRAAAAELDHLSRAVTAAARDYQVVEQTTAAGIER